MKRSRISLEQIAAWDNLLNALHKAARAKRQRSEVAHFLDNAQNRLLVMAEDIVQARMPYGGLRCFQIFDPKPRIIHAASFPDRVFHHALMNIAGPVLERSMVSTSFACRVNKGVHRAAQQVQYNLQRFPFYGQIDIDGYFAAIAHTRLQQVLFRHFKGEPFQHQLQRIIDGYHCKEGYGLPIGSLTSQYFANTYLNGLDRFLANDKRVCAQVRYMDDIIWWCREKSDVKMLLKELQAYLSEHWELAVKTNTIIQRSQQGVSYCGYHIFPGSIRLSRRRQQRYRQRRQYWEQMWQQGMIDDQQLQRTYASVLAISHGTDARAWRQNNLLHYPSPDV